MKKRSGLFFLLRQKKGLSPVIATILLIALVMVLASIVFLWARGFISEQIEKFGQPIDDVCADVIVDAELYKDYAGWKLDIANRGSVPIHHFDIKEISGGSSEIYSFDFSFDAGESGTNSVVLKTNPDEIIIYPVLLGKVKDDVKNTPYTCVEQGKKLIVEGY